MEAALMAEHVMSEVTAAGLRERMESRFEYLDYTDQGDFPSFTKMIFHC